MGRLARAETSEEHRLPLISYAWGGAAQLRGEVKTICKSAVALFGIPGDFTPTQIAANVEWLTSPKGIYKYGGIDLKPYGHPFYKFVLTKQWYDSAKADGVRITSYKSFVDTPLRALNLVTGGMEASLKEWATGVRVQVKFTEEEFAPRYQRHLAALLNIQEKSPTWFAQFQHNLYTKIVTDRPV
ncbi:hypothetical protein C8J57DRAFT_1247859 [Mycena rebaudengoi]|nr:hypothetical protein C8J57DRAFT_1247859 [Mycena rebaudengoi]